METKVHRMLESIKRENKTIEEIYLPEHLFHNAGSDQKRKTFKLPTSDLAGTIIVTRSPSIAATHRSMTPLELIGWKSWARHSTSSCVEGNLYARASLSH